ncbi:MAG: hypothetical protein ABSD73_07485 [Candidatus Bathyarchaeia archaeon]|jgi:hypothetical protein
MIERRISVFLILVCIGFLPLALPSAKGQAQESVSVYMINYLTENNTFNITDSPVNSVFTVDFCVGNVTDLITWQIRLTYNSTLIHYDEAWFPDDNVFQQAVGSGATPLTEVSNNVGNTTDVGDLLIVMTCSHSPSNSLKYPVTVTSKALMCKVNFTIAMQSTFTQIVFVAEQENPSNLYVAPPYYLAGYGTSVETLSGTYPADGDPAVITGPTSVSETSILLFLIWIPSTLALILTRRRTKRRDHDR